MKIISHTTKQPETLFDFETNSANEIISLKNSRDRHHMNWVKPDSTWGKIKTNKKLTTSIDRQLTSDGSLIENYTFTNQTEFEIDTLDTQLGIYLPFPDYYTDAAVSLNQCCHTHIWCGENSSYIMGLRMGGQAPNLGLALIRGSFQGYSIERRYDSNNHQENVSNDRGKFIFHPENLKLQPGDSYTISWKLFWFQNKADFIRQLQLIPGFISVEAPKFVLFKNEPIEFTIRTADKKSADMLKVYRDGKEIAVHRQVNKIVVKELTDRVGDYQYNIQLGNSRTKAVFHVSENLENLSRKRAWFITSHQQCCNPKSRLNGAYLIYDNEAHTQHYSHLNDHNGGRERVGMAVLVANYLRHHADQSLNQSLDRYLKYLFRELFDEKTGTVFNDVSRNNDDPRLYNYPWIGQLLLEVYQLKANPRYLDDYLKLINRFYTEGGNRFYAIGLPMLESVKVFKQAGRIEEADKLIAMYCNHVETLIGIGRNYPRSEVAYEQAIVAPAVIYMAEMGLITGEDRYKQAALSQLKDLDLFEGFQPDFHLNETAIRHWDDYWFGKNHTLGDTFPHYWTSLSGIAYLLAYRLTNDKHYQETARKSLRSSLSLFTSDGTASCAFVYPMAVNEKKGRFFDPWANDQDWGLYYALKYRQAVL